MNSLKLHYAKLLPVLLIVVGVLLLVTGLLTGDPLNFFPGIVLPLVGILLLVNPILVIENGEAQVKSPLGFTGRRFPVSGPGDLRAEEKRLVHVPTGKKVTSLGFGMNKDEVQQIRAAFPGQAA